MKRFFFFVTVFLLLISTLGFRVFPGFLKWPVDPTNNKIWVNFCSRPTVDNNDLPSGDPLAGQNIDFTMVTQSIFDDYNTVQTSFVRLYDEATDPTFASSNSTNRIIDVCFTTAPFGEAGNSGQVIRGSQVAGCKVNLDHRVTGSAKGFVRTVTHELGHCMGLDHAHDTTTAVMSYFSSAYRLATDDKMGLTFLYPSDPEYARETPTFGLSCAPKN